MTTLQVTVDYPVWNMEYAQMRIQKYLKRMRPTLSSEGRDENGFTPAKLQIMLDAMKPENMSRKSYTNLKDLFSDLLSDDDDI